MKKDLGSKLRKAVAKLHIRETGEGYYVKAYERGWHEALSQVEVLIQHYDGKPQVRLR